MGVYIIRNSKSDKVYIGYGTDVQAKINRHKCELKFGTHRELDLQKAMTTFGESVLQFEILDVLKHEVDSQSNPIDELKILAEMWINRLEKTDAFIGRL